MAPSPFSTHIHTSKARKVRIAHLISEEKHQNARSAVHLSHNVSRISQRTSKWKTLCRHGYTVTVGLVFSAARVRLLFMEEEQSRAPIPLPVQTLVHKECNLQGKGTRLRWRFGTRCAPRGAPSNADYSKYVLHICYGHRGVVGHLPANHRRASSGRMETVLVAEQFGTVGEKRHSKKGLSFDPLATQDSALLKKIRQDQSSQLMPTGKSQDRWAPAWSRHLYSAN